MGVATLLSLGSSVVSVEASESLPEGGHLVLNIPFAGGKDETALVFSRIDGAQDGFLTQAGGGVSGKGGDRAFDNTSSLKMGGTRDEPGEGGRAVLPSGARFFDGAMSFTIVGWYRSDDGQIPSNYARLISSPRVSLLFDSTVGKGLSLSTAKGAASCVDAAFRLPGRWVFFAITHDGSKDKENVSFYAGSAAEPVRLAARSFIAKGVIKASPSGSALVLGNLEDGSRPFDGLLDNIRIWADANGAGGVLNPQQLEQIRRLDIH